MARGRTKEPRPDRQVTCKCCGQQTTVGESIPVGFGERRCKPCAFDYGCSGIEGCRRLSPDAPPALDKAARLAGIRANGRRALAATMS